MAIWYILPRKIWQPRTCIDESVARRRVGLIVKKIHFSRFFAHVPKLTQKHERIHVNVQVDRTQCDRIGRIFGVWVNFRRLGEFSAFGRLFTRSNFFEKFVGRQTKILETSITEKKLSIKVDGIWVLKATFWATIWAIFHMCKNILPH
jgi:hypothetical protein